MRNIVLSGMAVIITLLSLSNCIYYSRTDRSDDRSDTNRYRYEENK